MEFANQTLLISVCLLLRNLHKSIIKHQLHVKIYLDAIKAPIKGVSIYNYILVKKYFIF